ncbi:MAG TPA: cytochrome P450 [Dehalococcoidia bacterium]|nr:cytochrome P450 [Dehalococcoidia bacterium]
MTTEQQPLTFNPLDPAFRENPYPTYSRLVREERVHVTPFGVKAFTRLDDCIAILRDHKRFSSDDSNAGIGVVAAGPGGQERSIDEQDRPFLFMDPPDHTRLRRLVNIGFSAKRIEAMRPRVEEIVTELLDAVEGKEEMDAIAELAYPLPVSVICEMLGVPREDEPLFKTWSRVLASALDPDIAVPPEVLKLREKAIDDSRAYFRDLIKRRGDSRPPDILSALLDAQAEGDKLSEKELLATCTLILIAGHETTVNLIGNGILQLLRHPDQLAKFQADPGLARSVVEEVLRFDPPVQFDGRLCVEQVEYAGVTINPGEFVMQLIGAANRDPSHFENPDTFDITRGNDRHLAFGFGIHFCLGAPLARLEGEIALRQFVQRFPNARLLEERPPYRAQITLRGLERLRVGLN